MTMLSLVSLSISILFIAYCLCTTLSLVLILCFINFINNNLSDFIFMSCY